MIHFCYQGGNSCIFLDRVINIKSKTINDSNKYKKKKKNLKHKVN